MLWLPWAVQRLAKTGLCAPPMDTVPTVFSSRNVEVSWGREMRLLLAHSLLTSPPAGGGCPRLGTPEQTWQHGMTAAGEEDSLQGLFLHDSGQNPHRAKVSHPWVLLHPSASGTKPAAWGSSPCSSDLGGLKDTCLFSNVSLSLGCFM